MNEKVLWGKSVVEEAAGGWFVGEEGGECLAELASLSDPCVNVATSAPDDCGNISQGTPKSILCLF